jgi:hypothetical protein
MMAETTHIKQDFSSLNLLSTDKDQGAFIGPRVIIHFKLSEQHIQFPRIQTVNLMEQLIAASREILERQQREKMVTTSTEADEGQQHQHHLEFSSPDSACASTSEDGGEQQQHIIAKNSILEGDDGRMSVKELDDAAEETMMEMDHQRNRDDRVSSFSILYSYLLIGINGPIIYCVYYRLHHSLNSSIKINAFLINNR